MPINNYEGKTFVAFLDISGFKSLMQKGEKEAWKALSRLYQKGYEILDSQENEFRVEGIFISDSGVLFVNKNDNVASTECLKSLLKKIKKINEAMRNRNFMLTTSIAFGKFKYQERIEFKGIEKNPIYGEAYVTAFLDNEYRKPKIQPGQCRIVKKNLPSNVLETLQQSQNDSVFSMIRKRENDEDHYYYYWMRNEPGKIESFEQNYKNAFNLKYEGILKALKGK